MMQTVIIFLGILAGKEVGGNDKKNLGKKKKGIPGTERFLFLIEECKFL